MAKKSVFKRNLRSRFGPGLWLLIALVFMLIPAGQAFGQEIIIEDWPGDQVFFVDTNPPHAASDFYPATVPPYEPGIIGGQREVWLRSTVGSSPSLGTKAVTFDYTVASGGPGTDCMSISIDSGTNGEGTIIWESQNPYDLYSAAGTQTAFLFRWLENDHNIALTFRVHDGVGSADKVFNLLAGVPQENITVPFTDFPGIDFTNITKMEMIVPEQLVPTQNDVNICPIKTQGQELECVKTLDGQSSPPWSVVNTNDVVPAQVTVTATGPGTLLVDIVDTLATGLAYEAVGTADPPDSIVGQVLTWYDRPVSEGSPIVLDYNVRVTAVTSLIPLCNDVEVFPEGATAPVTECFACVLLEEIEVDCDKVFSTHTVALDDVITATVDVGVTPLGATVVVDVEDTLDLGLIYEAATTINPPDTVTGDGITTPMVLTWEDRLAPVQLVYDIKVIAIDPGEQLCNSVEVYDEDGVPFDPPVECFDCVSLPAVPTFTQWGIIGLTFLLSVSGVWLTRRRRSKK